MCIDTSAFFEKALKTLPPDSGRVVLWRRFLIRRSILLKDGEILIVRQEIFNFLEEGFEVRRGYPLPLGATPLEGGLNFAIYSKYATMVRLVIFLPGEEEPLLELPLEPDYHRTGFIWHVMIKGINQEIEYGYRMDRENNDNLRVHRFDSRRVLLDPYAKAIVGGEEWGTRDLHEKKLNGSEFRTGRRGKIIRTTYNWEFEKKSTNKLSDLIIYELHVRAFTIHPSSKVNCPGTYLGLTEKIPYLKDLGINAVELMPVTEFDEGEIDRIDPLTNKPLLNLWGYNPIGFFAPKAAYAAKAKLHQQVQEFKDMIKAFHSAGIEVILDVVFNHTAEGNDEGPTLSFRGIDNKNYYMLDLLTGNYLNFSGCGNTLNCNHRIVRDMLVDCLRYWVMEMHVDGFRFDLASILGRGKHGEVLPNPPILERIAEDPVLANTKLIAEAWDAAGLYQVGSFPHSGRWAEWNGKYRDDIRKFVRGDIGITGNLMTRLSGSSDLYQLSGREPGHSINFITCHDGFTLKDLVSYNVKHNEHNGEFNKDGMDDNLSWNCGTEGKTDDAGINDLRLQQQKNFAAILLLSRGVPMVLAGDEFGKTQMGNNNCYCQDNELSWIDWSLLEKNTELYNFFRNLIHLRRNHSVLRYGKYMPNPATGEGGIAWYDCDGAVPENPDKQRAIAMILHGGLHGSDFYIAVNSEPDDILFEIPKAPSGNNWALVLDTSKKSPYDFRTTAELKKLVPQKKYLVKHHSIITLKTI